MATIDEFFRAEAERMQRKAAERPRFFIDRIRIDPIGPAGVSALATCHNWFFGFDRVHPEGMGETSCTTDEYHNAR